MESKRFCFSTALRNSNSTFSKKGERIVAPKYSASLTFDRQELALALCAGLGNVGYSSKWTIESLVTDNGIVPLTVGASDGQIFFKDIEKTSAICSEPDRRQNDVEGKNPKITKIIER